MAKKELLLERLKGLKEDLMLGRNAWKATKIVELLDEVIEELERQMWVPVSSGIMPEDGEYVFVSAQRIDGMGGGVGCAVYKGNDEGGAFYSGSEPEAPLEALGFIPTAWMLMPDDYEEGLA